MGLFCIRSAATRTPARIVLSAGRSEVGGAAFLSGDPALEETLEEGLHADPYPGSDGFRPDRFTTAPALRYLDIRRPAFLFVGLGEPDEYAHRGDYVGYLGALRAADHFVGELFATLDRMGERGRRTLVLLTADHGRGASQSRRSPGGWPTLRPRSARCSISSRTKRPRAEHPWRSCSTTPTRGQHTR